MQFLRKSWFLLRRRQLSRDLTEEMELHFDLKVQDYIAAGKSAEEAKRQAHLDFGNVAVAQERSREKWGFPLLESTRQDLGYGLRQLRRNPGFTAVAALTLALGIGANSAIFSVVNAFLLRSLPVKNPVELVHIRNRPNSNFEPRAYEQLRDHQKTLVGLIAWDEGNITIRMDETASVVRVDYVSGNFYSLLGVEMFRGRALSPEDDMPGKPAIAVISYGYWKNRLGMDPTVIGKTVQLKDITCTIVGVSSPGFRGLQTGGPGASITLPAQWHEHLTLKDNTTFSLFGRLGKGTDPQKAQADLNVIYHQWLQSEVEKVSDPHQRQELMKGTIVVSAARQGSLEFSEYFSAQLRLVEAVVGLVLVIACANLANLLLARGTSRSRELAIRLALGAERNRIVRQLLTENLLLSLCGGALALVLSMQLVRLFLFVLLGESEPSVLGIELDGTVLIFTFAVSIVTGLLFGLAPALRTASGSFTSLRGQATDPSGKPVQPSRSLVVPQVAISLVVLVLAGLLLRSLHHMQEVDLGFEQDHLLAFWLFPTLSGYEGQRELDLYDRVIEGLNRTPGVRVVSLSRLGLLHRGRTSRLTVDGMAYRDARYVFNTAAPRFFETLRLPLLLGRDFAPSDGPESTRVAIINQSMARKYFPENPIGRRIGLEAEEPGTQRTIVGVVKDMKFSLRDDMPAEAVYLPYAQAPDNRRGQAEIKVRTALNPTAMIATIRDEVHAVAKDLPLVQIGRLDEQLQQQESAEEHSLAKLFSGFGVLGLGLALLGLYGTVSYSVSQRLHELAIRIALGAQPQGLPWMVVGEAIRYVAAGVVLGIALAMAASHLLKSFLFGVKGFDPVTYFVVTAVLLATAV